MLQSGLKRQLEPADEPGTLSVKWPYHVCLGVNMPLNVLMSTAADPLDVACDLLVNNRRRIAGGRITAASTEPTFYMLPVVFDTEQPRSTTKLNITWNCYLAPIGEDWTQALLVVESPPLVVRDDCGQCFIDMADLSPSVAQDVVEVEAVVRVTSSSSQSINISCEQLRNGIWLCG